MSTQVTPDVQLPNEFPSVETPVLDWLQAEVLGWRYEDATAVAREYRARRNDGTVDEREVILCPSLRNG